jgi:universal stress protein E
MPAPLTHILVATDFSDNAALAASRAALLASDHNARLHLLHVTERGLMKQLTQWLGEQEPWHERINQQTQHSLDLLAEQLRNGLPHAAPDVQTLHMEGPVTRTVLEAARQCKASMLVVGQHGQGNVRDMVMGTTTERMLNQSTLPVLVVRTPSTQRYQHILVALDLSPHSEHALTLVRTLFPAAHLVLMHGFSVPFEEKLRFAGVDEATVAHYRDTTRDKALHHIHSIVQRHGLMPHQFTTVLREGDAARLLTDTAAHHHCDLIVISKQQRSAPDELLLGSVTRHTLAEATMDVLITAHA